MGLQPIDLQVMYSQVANVAKIAADADRGVQLAQDMQQRGIVQQNTEEAKKVRQLRENEALTPLNSDGSAGGQSYSSGRQKRKPKNPSQDEILKEVSRLKEDYLGNKLDITG